MLLKYKNYIKKTKSIDDLIESTRRLFIANRDFDPIFSKYEINYFVDYPYPDLSITTSEGKKFIFNYPKLFRATREFSTAHELCHLILYHQENNVPKDIAEVEADYFASRLTGHSKIKLITLGILETIIL